jgi:ankyrin repeat protein
MKYVIVLIGSLCCATASDNRIGSAHVVNGADHMLNVEIGISTRGQADVIITNIDAQEALFKAIRKDSAQGVRDAVRDGADVNQMIQDKTPLMWAVLLYRLHVAPELLQLGACVDTECIRVAMKTRSVIMPVLVEHWNDAAHVISDPSVLRDVASFVRSAPNPTVALEYVRALIKKGVTLNEEVWDSVIRKMNSANNNECALELIRAAAHGPDINVLWYAALCLGSLDSYRGEEAVKLLLARGANPNRKIVGEYAPLCYAACRCRNKNIVRLLLAAGADINLPAEILYHVASCDNSEILQLLIAAGANVHERYHGKSILSIVLANAGGDEHQKAAAVTLLLEHGAEL